eukprot:GFUD01002319.1.p1 GENE.GFUD01002319.1~~GFUD01002319.1.p1  ORF type:complete len:652 (-),score=150.80 GFUD01002319.1:85-2040(-)
MSLENGKLGEKNASFQMEESVLNSSEQYLDVDLSGKKKSEYEEKVKISKSHDDTDDLFEDKEYSGNILGDAVEKFWEVIGTFVKKHWTVLRFLMLLTLVVSYNAYLIGSIYHGVSTKESLDYCDDVGFLLIITIVIYISMFYFMVVKTYYRRLWKIPMAKTLYKSVIKPGREKSEIILSNPYASQGAYLTVLVVIAVFIFIDTADDPRRLISAFGILVLILLGFIFSKHPGYVVWRHVAWGLGLQFVFGLLILRWEVGKAVFGCLGRKVSTFLDYTDAGSGFVFGYLVDQKPFLPFLLNGTANSVAEEINSSGSLKFVFMFKVLSIIYFFNFMVSILFYLGAMRWLVVKMGWLLQVSVGTTACESMNAAGNIFLGQTEAPLMIKPYLPDMTKSELHAVMTGGFATIAGSVLAAYISFGISASHLLSASVMSAPAALAYAKLFYPETKKSRTTADNLAFPKSEDANVLDAAANGASQSVFLVGNIAGSLIAFLAFVAFLNGLLGWFGGLVGAPFLSFEYLLGWVFYPLAFIMGVPCGKTDQEAEDECQLVAVLVGLKTIVNEFAAYDRLSLFRAKMSQRSIAIATYALCGFSNPASIGVQIAALSYMAPTRRGHISQVAIRAFIAGSAACFLTACIAGTLIKEDGEVVLSRS